MPETVLVFDLDGCLYPLSTGYVKHIRDNIYRFMEEKGFVEEGKTAYETWLPLFKKYNQTFRALKSAGYEFDEDAYWEYHRRGTKDFLKEDKGLRSWLESLPHRKVVFTNCAETQARDALAALGVEDCFSDVLGAKMMGDVCKPEVKAFEMMMEKIGVTDASQICYFEDSYKNMKAGMNLGMKTVFVDSETAREEGVTDEQRAACSAVVSTLSDPEGKQLQHLDFLYGSV
jgi:putative hydrolase of the HAD superfamily